MRPDPRSRLTAAPGRPRVRALRPPATLRLRIPWLDSRALPFGIVAAPRRLARARRRHGPAPHADIGVVLGLRSGGFGLQEPDTEGGRHRRPRQWLRDIACSRVREFGCSSTRKPRRGQASPLFRLVSNHLRRLQTVYDDRFVRKHHGLPPALLSSAARA
jgi:hypothetical protein